MSGLQGLYVSFLLGQELKQLRIRLLWYRDIDNVLSSEVRGPNQGRVNPSFVMQLSTSNSPLSSTIISLFPPIRLQGVVLGSVQRLHLSTYKQIPEQYLR